MKHLRFSLLAAFLCFSVLGRASAGPILYIDDENGLLGTVDVATGTATVIGSTGQALTDIAFAPTGELYGITFTDLYKINPNTGVSKLIGPHNIPEGNALVFGSDGTLYAAGATTSDLYFIDTRTGASTDVTEIGYESAGDLAFNNGELFLSSNTNQLIEIDPETFGTTLVGDFGFTNVYGLATGDNGVLYGVSGTQIFSVDTATGAGTFLVDYGGQGLGAADGTSFVSESVPTITSPATANGQVAQNFSYTITATNNPYYYGAENLPPGLNVDSGTGIISGLPTEVGTFSVYLYVFNFGGGQGDATITVTVAPAAVPVITSTTAAKAKTGKFFHYQLAAANSPTSLSVGDLPPGLTYYPAEAVISGTPTKVGTYSIALAAANSGGTSSATLTLDVAVGPPVREVVTLSATISVVTAESGQEGVFTVTRLGTNRAAALHINYSVEGTAVSGSDFVPIKHFKTLTPGQKTAKIRIHPIGDGGGAGVERVVRLILEPGQGYIVENPSSSQVKIIGR
jgi:hypothetical protein